MIELKIDHHFRRIRRHALRHKKQAVKSFHTTHKHAHALLKKHRVVLEKVRHHTVKSAAIAGVSVGVLATPAIVTSQPAGALAAPIKVPLARVLIQDRQAELNLPQTNPHITYGPSAKLASLDGLLPAKIQSIAPTLQPNLTDAQAAQMAELIHEAYGVKVTNQLDGIRLDQNQGIIAGEQHLPLYPGDVVSNHTSDPTWNLTGMVPGLPSYGYYAPNRQSVTQQDIDLERYYMALQTFKVAGFSSNPDKIYSWFKYRNMLIIDRDSGRAVKVDVSDAGPSPFTGRTFGASNETLIGLGLGAVRTGHVYVFFVDPSDTTSLGPLGATK